MKTYICLLLIAATTTALAAEKDPMACKDLRDQVKATEAQQRQPQPGYEQDRLTALKRKTLEQMKQLECSTM